MMPPAVARHLGRPDLARGNGIVRSGQGAVYGRGATAAGLSAEATVGGQTGRVSAEIETGQISAMLLAGIVVGLVGWYLWTRGSQA